MILKREVRVEGHVDISHLGLPLLNPGVEIVYCFGLSSEGYDNDPASPIDTDIALVV